MVNPFLSSKNYDTETAIMLERANVLDIGNAVAFTDGDRIFINTQDNLFKILPNYDDGMLKWLLWHERMHMELKHHNRFFKYLDELSESKTMDEFQVTKDEVNIIMDILVHDWMSSKFPELIETAVNNLAQFRDRNSLKYTFKTNTLEEMLDEYKEFKHKSSEEDKSKDGEPEEDESEETKEGGKPIPDKSKDKSKDKDKSAKAKGAEKGHAEGGHGDESATEDKKPEVTDESEQPAEDAGHHDETDWEKLEEIDQKEFITKQEGNKYIDKINELKRKKFKLAKLTQTLNGLITTTKARTYKTPSYMQTGQHTIFKGRQPGRAALYLCFDASGSMSGQMLLFKDIISKSIPQALKTPTVWFSGYGAKIKEDKDRHDYYTGTFEDFLPVLADSGYSDDGDRTIELCYLAEQMGYSPIGITDGGGTLSWSKDKLKLLKRTIFVGQNEWWLNEVKKVNPHIQTLYID